MLHRNSGSESRSAGKHDMDLCKGLGYASGGQTHFGSGVAFNPFDLKWAGPVTFKQNNLLVNFSFVFALFF